MSPRLSLPLLSLLAAYTAAPGCLWSQEPGEKAARILEPLLKRPGSGPLFERFVNAWLDAGTLEDLGKFLAKRAADDPSTPNHLLLALFHSRQGEPVKALEQFRAALVSDPGSADIWYQKALLESRTLDFDAAITSLQKCLAANPAGELPLQASQLLGRLQARAGRTEEALKTWQALIQSRPGDEELREDILELQIAESLWPAARESAEQLVEKTADPYRRVLRRMRLGDVFDRSGQRDKALETFAACLEDTGAGSWLEKEILSQIERLFRREDDLAGLRACFTRLLTVHARRAGLQRAMARLLMEAGETAAAIECGRALLALSPGDRAVREEFIALLQGAGRAAEAIPQVELLLTQMPDDLELRLTLADLKHAAKDSPGALTEMKEYARRAAGKEGATLRVAGLMERYGAADEALQTLRTALERADQPETRLMLASLLHKSGKKDEALAEWKRVAGSGALPAVQQAARAMQSHGESAAAWELLRSAAAGAENDPVFLTQLCTLADSPERAQAALPSVQRLVELAKTGPDLGTALDTAQRVVRLSGKADEFVAGLSHTATAAQTLCLLAALREAARDTIGANAALEKARALSPELALGQSVRLWTVRGDFAQAALAAETLFNSPGGRHGHVAEMLASLHQRAGNPAAALRWTQEWRKLVPGAAAPVLGEARLLEAMGREADALAALRSAAGRFEGNEEVRARLAELCLDTGRVAEALRYYGSLYEEAADLAARMRWLGRWGEAAEQAGQLDNLIAQFEDRRRENRGTVAPLMALAELHRIADNYDARRSALTEASRLKPDDPEIALEIARLESRENDPEAAIRTLRPMLAKDTTGRVAALLSDLLISSGQLEEGLQLLTGSTAAAPGAVELAALSLARRDEEKSALAFLLPHLTSYPDDSRLQFLAALLEWRTGSPEAAAARLLPLTGAPATVRRAGGAMPPASAGQSYEDMVMRLMPPDVQRLFRLLLAAAELSPGNNGPWGNSRQSVYTSLPADAEEMQNRAAAVLVELANAAAPEKRETWLSELERRGYACARLLPELPTMRRLQPANRYYNFEGLLRDHPDNRPLLAVAALSAAYRQWNEPADASLGGKAWAALRDDAPAAALLLALPGAGQGKTRAPWENEVLTAAEKLETVPPLLTLAAMRSAGLLMDDEFPIALPRAPDPQAESPPDEWRRRMVALLARWHSAADTGGGMRGYAESLREFRFRSLARAYVIKSAAAPLAALLDSEWRWQISRPQPVAGLNSRDNLAQPLGFPPWFLPGLPETLRSFLQSNLTAETAAQTVPLIQEPVLRALLAARLPGDSADKAIQEVQPGTATTAVPFILSASRAEKRGDFAAAGDLAVKALYLPVSQEARRRLDGALAYWASKKAKPGDGLHAAGREAALRLRRDAVTPERRAELATLMDRLGLAEEADRLMRQGKAAESSASTPDERLQKLLDEGRTREALPALTSEIRGWARHRLTHGSQPADETLMAWRKRVQVNGLLSQVRQSLLPAQPTAQQLAEYAAACELLGEPAPAREYYERALTGGIRKKAPQNLLTLVYYTAPERAHALLKEYPDLWSPEAVRAWTAAAAYSQSRRIVIEDLSAFADFMTRALDALPEKHAVVFPAEYVMDLAENDAACGDFAFQRGVSRTIALSFTSGVPEAERRRVESLVAARMDACERLCRRLLLIPGCGLSAWEHLGGIQDAREKPRAELLPDGMAMLVSELKVPATRRQHQLVDNQLERLCFTFIQQSCTAGRLADFAREVIPVVRATRSPKTADSFLEAWPLYDCAPDQFAATSRGLFKARGAEIIPGIIEAAELRKLGADLEPDLLAHFSQTENIAERNDYQFGTCAGIIESARGRAAAETFSRTVLEAVLGPAPKRAELFKQDDTSRLDSAKRLIGSLANRKEWTGYALRFFRDEVLPHLPEEQHDEAAESTFPDQVLGSPLYLLVTEEDYAGAKAWLDALPVSEDLASFWGGHRDALSYAHSTLSSLSEEQQRKLGLGGDVVDLSFGRRVLRGLARGGFQDVFGELHGWESRIEALPEPARTRVTGSLRALDPGRLPGLTPQARAFRSWLMKEKDEKARAETEKSITEFFKKAETGGFESEEALAGQLKSLLFGMGQLSHPRGREVAAAAHRAAEGMGAREQRSLLVESVLELICDNRAYSEGNNPGWQLGILAALLKEGEPAGFAYLNYTAGIGTWLHELPGDDLAGKLDVFVSEAGPHLLPGEARLLMVRAMMALSDQSPGPEEKAACLAGLEWAEEARGRCAHEELRFEIELALRFHIARSDDRGAKNITAEADLPVEQRHYLTLLRDGTLPAELRRAIGKALLEMAVVEPPLILEVARQLHQALADGQPVTPEEEASVFSTLGRLPAAARDEALLKSLMNLTTLPRQRGEARGAHGCPQLLDFALQYGDTATVDRLLEMDGPFPGTGALSVLARHGEKQRLADLLKKRPEVLQNTQDDSAVVGHYDAALAAQLPAVVEGIADPELRFEMLARLSSSDDVEPFPPGLKPNAVRSLEMSAAFAGLTWRSPEVRDRVMDVSVFWKELPPDTLTPQLQETAARVPLAAIPHMEGGYTRWTAFHAILITRALAAGNAQPLAEALESLETVTARHSDHVDGVRSALLAWIHDWLAVFWPVMTPESRAAACEGYRAALTRYRTAAWRQEWAKMVHRALTLHALAGQMDALRTWHSTLGETDRAWIRREISNFTPQSALGSFEFDSARMPGAPEDKAALLRASFLALAENPLGCGPGTEFDKEFLAVKGATPEEFLKMEEPLTVARPDDGWLAAAFARVHASRGNWDGVLARTAAAMAKIKPERNSAYAPLLELRVQALEKLGRGAEAEPEIKALPTLPEANTSADEAASRAAESRLRKRLLR